MTTVLIIILSIFFLYVFLLISWSGGFIRAMQLMTQKGLKKSKIEKHLIKHIFKNKKGNVDPFLESIYMKDELGKISQFYINYSNELKSKIINKNKDVVEKPKKKKSGKKSKK